MVINILPGRGYSGYVSLSDVMKNGSLSVNGTSIFFDGRSVSIDRRVLQGLTIAGEFIRIRGVHFTSWEQATQIRSAMRVEPSLDDPFVYLAEPGLLENAPSSVIRKELGSSFADTMMEFTIVVRVERVWLKVSRNVAHYAVSGIVWENDIKSLTAKRRRIS